MTRHFEYTVPTTAPTLAEMAPKDLLETQQHRKSPAYRWRHCTVIGLFWGDDPDTPWPGPHGKVEEWYVLDNGWAVAWVKGAFGWHYPTVRYRLRH